MYRFPTCIHAVEHYAAAAGEHVAVADEHISLTYSQLDRLTDAAAHLLRRHVQAGEAVAVIADCSVTSVLAPLAAMKAACVYVPIYAQWPPHQIAAICRDANVRIAIADDHLCHLLPRNVTTIAASQLTAVTASESGALPHPAPSDLAFIVYTSGSSGQPKGCMLTHRNLTAQAANCELNADDISASYMPHNSVAFIHGTAGALSAGASIRIIPHNARLSPTDIAHYITRHNATAIMLPARIAAKMSAMELPSLRQMTGVGEAWQPQAIPSTFALYNSYGASEICGGALRHHITEDMTPMPVGTPLPFVDVLILDDELQPANDGQLAIAGEVVGAGYLNLPELTAKHFITLNGQRLFLTGDHARRLPDGNIVVDGRIDRMVKIDGWRVELDAIEAAIRQLPSVQAAAVRTFAHGQSQHLCAYFQSNRLQPADVRRRLQAVLPPYMVPTHITHLDSLPLTPSGKPDYPHLPEPQWQSGSADLPDELRRLTDIAQRVLSAPIPDADADLIALGLSSLSALELSIAIEEQLGMQISAAAILAFPTIAQIRDKATLALNLLRRQPSQPLYPLMAGQRRMVQGAIDHPHDPKNLIVLALEADGITAEQLQQAVNEVIDTHRYLCMQFTEVNGEIMQRRGCQRPPVVVKHLAEPCTVADMLAEARPWPILNEPLTRFVIFAADHQPVRLLIATMHAISDAASIHILINDICAACAGHALKPEIIDAFDLTLCEQQLETAPEGHRCRQFFDELCQDSFIVDRLSPVMPTDEPEAPGRLSFEVDTATVEAIAHRLAVTPNAVMVTTMMQAISVLTEQSKVLVSTFSNRRNLLAVSRTQGMLLRTLPIVWERGGHAPAAQVQQMQQRFRRLMLCDLYPFCNYADRHTIPMQFLYIFQEELASMTPPAPWRQLPLSAAADDATAICCVQVLPGRHTYNIIVEYNGLSYRRAHVERLAALWRANLNALL